MTAPLDKNAIESVERIVRDGIAPKPVEDVNGNQVFFKPDNVEFITVNKVRPWQRFKREMKFRLEGFIPGLLIGLIIACLIIIYMVDHHIYWGWTNA